ncbi:MAG: outer membrane lipoprotein carrier protein LolA [Desulfobacterales bacterium PC51MH44]|nr:MAG: outer membrane lipoprotein carrier protein LolA [Desulfobacterales bacterium PC51MH44]
MKFKLTTFLFFILVIFYAQAGLCQDSSPALNSSAEKSNLLLDDIIGRVEKRYAVSGFSAHFFQVSTIKAMEITDTASGKAFFKRPGKMRWEYEKPDRQIIITDGKTLWIYRPDDNQVMIGKSPSFFGDGKGASFLSDMKLIRQKFSVLLEKKTADGYYVLKLLPKEKTFDVSVINLSISTKTFDVFQIITYNSYEDETRIELSNIEFKPELNDSMFSFQIPQGVEILQLEE